MLVLDATKAMSGSDRVFVRGNEGNIYSGFVSNMPPTVKRRVVREMHPGVFVDVIGGNHIEYSCIRIAV